LANGGINGDHNLVAPLETQGARMKKKRLRLIILSPILILLMEYIVLSQFPPSVAIVNKTDKVVYINVVQWPTEIKDADELTDAELSQLKRFVPVQPQNTHNFPASFSTLIDSRLMSFSPTWGIGAPAPTSSADASGSHSFDLDLYNGTCRVEIEVYDDSYKITPKETLYCYKKLLPMGGNMIIHTKEKTIFNNYGPSADKIENQVVRCR
jgi:hypothetical protein